jgi:Mg-chelatase subunit ChlD
MKRSTRFGLAALTGLYLVGCGSEGDGLSPRISNLTAETGSVSLALSVSDENGEPVALSNKTTSAEVEARDSRGRWQALSDVTLAFQGPALIDVVVVADNSGSQREFLGLMADSIEHHAQRIINDAQRDRVGLVRVSTEANVLSELTTSTEEFSTALGEMFITNGWTALWDGVRTANEVLTRGALALAGRHEQKKQVSSEFCLDRAHRAVVVFTDGGDNNSADEHETRYPGDGIDTTLEDLLDASVSGTQVPVHAIGVGDEVDRASLERLALETGGTYRPIDHFESLHGVLESTAATLRYEVPVCFTLPGCDFDRVRANVEVQTDTGLHAFEVEVSLPSEYCSSAVE